MTSRRSQLELHVIIILFGVGAVLTVTHLVGWLELAPLLHVRMSVQASEYAQLHLTSLGKGAFLILGGIILLARRIRGRKPRQAPPQF